MSRKSAKRNNSNVVSIESFIERKKHVVLQPRNLNQEKYIHSLLNEQNTMVFAHGPAGTGKTMLAVLAAIKALRSRDVERIVITEKIPSEVHAAGT